MTNFKKVFLIGFIGGLVGYACGAMFTPTLAIAQSSPDAGTADAGTTDAGAATTVVIPRPCRQWEVKVVQGYPGNGVVFEEGWEPFAYYGGNPDVILRRCVR